MANTPIDKTFEIEKQHGKIQEGVILSKDMPYYSVTEYLGGLPLREYWRMGYDYYTAHCDVHRGRLHLHILQIIKIEGHSDRIAFVPTYEDPDGDKKEGRLKFVRLKTFKKYLQPHPKLEQSND